MSKRNKYLGQFLGEYPLTRQGVRDLDKKHGYIKRKKGVAEELRRIDELRGDTETEGRN